MERVGYDPKTDENASANKSASGKKIYNADTGRWYTSSTADEVVDSDSDDAAEAGEEAKGAAEADGAGGTTSKLASFMSRE